MFPVVLIGTPSSRAFFCASSRRERSKYMLMRSFGILNLLTEDDQDDLSVLVDEVADDFGGVDDEFELVGFHSVASLLKVCAGLRRCPCAGVG